MVSLAQAETGTVCWSCGQVASGHFCESCGKIQPAQGTDYFSFFGLPRKLNIDMAALEREFYRLSRKLHPDINARADGLEQEWSLEKTSQLNDAHRTLKDPVLRTEYLLRLQGVQLEEQSKAATEEARRTGAVKKQVVPPDLLEEVFELNMQLEEMRMNQKMGEDDPQLRGDLEKAKTQFEGQMAESDAQLQALGAEWDAGIDAQDEAAKAGVKDKLVALLDRRRYVRNLVRDVNEALGG